MSGGTRMLMYWPTCPDARNEGNNDSTTVFWDLS
jgi:hypothetical protein